MTFFAAIGWSLLRGVAVAMIGTWLAREIVSWLHDLVDSWRRLAWVGLLVSCFTPSLMIGYCYRDTSISLLPSPFLRELLYAAIIAVQGVPVAVLLIWFAPPPPVSDSAVHCQSLLEARGLSVTQLWLRSKSRSLVPAAAVLFLLTFQEADLAALLQASSWTEWLYTQHAGGLPLSESLRLAAVPVAVQLPVLVPILIWILQPSEAAGGVVLQRPAGRGGQGVAAGWIAAGLLLVFAVPAWQLWRGARQSWPALLDQPGTWRELSDAGLLAVTSGGLALTIALVLHPGRTRAGIDPARPRGVYAGRVCRLAAFLFLMIPGLLGNLALGLLLAGIFQTPLLLAAYDTPVPLVSGETLALLPRVVILLCCVLRMSRATSDHMLLLLERSSDTGMRSRLREVRWRTTGRIWFGVILLTCSWAYLEVMLPSLLAMPGLVPVGLVLYNSLHYGRISALGAKLVLAMALPVLLAFCFLVLRRLSFSLR